MEAMKRSSTVIVCPSSNGHSCRRDNNWDHGWVVFSDGNGNGTVQDIELVESFPAPHERIMIEAVGATKSRASFNSTGLRSDHDAMTGQFRICMKGSSAAPRLIEVEADGFLYNMVRNLVGTLVEVGKGKQPVVWPEEILAARDRRLAGPTAPPQGLYLLRVLYSTPVP